MELVHERRGSGPPLVLLHGLGHHWRAWEPVLDRLADRHEVIAVDLPGFGASVLPPGQVPADMPEVVTAVAAFLARFGLDRPHVAGNSFGGAIALELACAGLVSSATALAPAGFCTRLELRWAIGVLRAHRLAAHLPEPVLRTAVRTRPVRALSFGMIVAKPGRLQPEAALRDALALRHGKGFRTVARAGRTYAFGGRPDVPVTVAWGTRDRVLLYRQADRARRHLPHARHVTLHGCGHVPMNDDPELVASVILETTAAAVGERPAGTGRPDRLAEPAPLGRPEPLGGPGPLAGPGALAQPEPLGGPGPLAGPGALAESAPLGGPVGPTRPQTAPA
jgi:pimeloyl-ACP methyl ester carboxylesterase